tara:strand:- start:7850 stop:9334 length:1485 start_codon:yes stop_codon:yes gene_type:complete
MDIRKKLYGLLALLSLLSFTSTLVAQNSIDDLKFRKWRITLFPPVSTNGTQSVNYSAKYSINLLAGYHGALDGYEVGALFNYTKYYSSGFQLSGLANLTNGEMEGFNVTGGVNYAKEYMAGIQLAGLANISDDRIEGLQFAGFVNYSQRGSSGLQAAGFANISSSDIEGLQAASLFNFTKDDISGLQSAGIFNFAGDYVEGLQAAGVFNFAGSGISGLQAAGFANASLGNIEGLLASGFINYAGEDASGLLASGGFNIGNNIEGLAAAGIGNFAYSMEGLQIAGINMSNEAVGLQIGILNIAKEFEGVSIGLLSIYGNGRKNVDVRFSDAGFTEIGITTGTHRVYNSFLLGYNTLLDRDVYRIGLAIGLEKNIQDSFENIESTTLFVNQEFSLHHIIEGDWSSQKNRILSYKYLLGNRFNNGFSIYAGWSLNMQVTRIDEAKDYTWYSFWSPTRKGKQYRFWIGATVGIRLFHQKNLPLISDNFDNDWGWGRDW